MQLEKVQLEDYDCILIFGTDRLKNYKIENLKITDPSIISNMVLEYQSSAINTCFKRV